MDKKESKQNIFKAGIILINNQNHILLVKGKKKGKKWGFPKGSIEEGETILDCANREFREETGMEFSGTENFVGKFINNGCHYFIINIDTETLDKVYEIDADEVSEVKWFFENHIKKINANRSLRKYYECYVKDKYKKQKKNKNIDEDGWTTIT